MVSTVAKERDTTFGSRLRALRQEAGLTQQQLAERLGMLPTNITRLETGGRQPSWDLVVRLAKALGVPTDSFLPREE